jgi:hypothetical protein
LPMWLQSHWVERAHRKEINRNYKSINPPPPPKLTVLCFCRQGLLGVELGGEVQPRLDPQYACTRQLSTLCVQQHCVSYKICR